ncbi:MAG: DUF3558 domain-containing protein [Pseudonocardiaceae bacterium]
MREGLAMLMVTAAVAVPASACGAASVAGPGAGATSAAPSSAPTLPPRPREIDLTGVDACTLLTPQQQRQLGTDRAPVASGETDRYGNPYCHYSKALSSPYFGYTLQVVTQEDATLYLTGERDVTARVVSVAGFPAVENHRPLDERGCFVDVSTKDGQYLDVQYAESTGSNDPTEVACEKARSAAELAMQTLLTQR